MHSVPLFFLQAQDTLPVPAVMVVTLKPPDEAVEPVKPAPIVIV
jgi:hypothetical protein